MFVHRYVACVFHVVLASTVSGCSSTAEEELEDSASALSVTCSNTARERNGHGLESLGFQQNGTRPYEYKWHQSGSHSYWREATALRYEKGSRVAYATCHDTLVSPLPLGAVTLTGEYYQYKCVRQPCLAYDWTAPTPGTATIEVKDFGLKQLGGAAQLVVRVHAGWGPSVIDKDVMLTKSGDVWSNREGTVSFTVQNDSIVASTITTSPPFDDSLDATGRRLAKPLQFRSDDGSASVAALKTVAIVDGPSGIKASPSSLTFAGDEAGKIRLINSSSYSVVYASANTTPGSLARREAIELSVGIPAVLELDPGFGEPVVVTLKVAP